MMYDNKDNSSLLLECDPAIANCIFFEVVLPNLNFNLELNNPNSQEFKSLQTSVINTVKFVICGAAQNCFVTVTGFRPGSVIATVQAAAAAGVISQCDMLARLDNLPAQFSLGFASISAGKSKL